MRVALVQVEAIRICYCTNPFALVFVKFVGKFLSAIQLPLAIDPIKHRVLHQTKLPYLLKDRDMSTS